MNEIWKQVPEFNRYWVSNLGRVKSVYKHRPPRILKQSKTHKGYLSVSLCEKGLKKTLFVHRIVAICFLDNPLKLPQINHKDEDKLNNLINNLEWCDGYYNQEYSHSKIFKFTSPSGEVFIIKNLNKFCREKNLPVGNMHRLHKGVHKCIKGWTS